MSDYFKIFETEDLYSIFRRTVDESTTPNVSLVTETDKVWYNRDDEWYHHQYLTFVALEDGTFTFTIDKDNFGGTLDITSISYSTDGGETWTTTTRDSSSLTVITTPTITTGNKVLWKGIGNKIYASNGPGIKSKFSSTCNFKVYGNINSLLYGDDFYNNNKSSKDFRYLFYYCTKLISAKNLILPATTLEDYCYSYMFGDCTSLTMAPSMLPATILANGCYNNMFQHCTSLTTAPELPAIILAKNCYSYMFYGCTSLTTAPVLIATMLTQNCYGGMFQDCTSLTTAPELPATTLASYCYYYMFQGCTSLTTAPELLATTLADYCYDHMFNGCTSLTTAPELPATTLVSNCYQLMFLGCSKLNYIKAMFTTTLGTLYMRDWVKDIASSGTFVKNSAATWTNGCSTSTYPCNWTVETASE